MHVSTTSEIALPARKLSWTRFGRLIWLNTFVRGFFGALSALTLLADVFNLESYEAARAIHAVIVGWSTVARQIGAVIGLLPFIPKLDAGIVNTMVFMATVTVPALFGLRRFMTPLAAAALPAEPGWLRWSVNWLFPLGIGYLFVFGTVAFQGGDIASLHLRGRLAESSPLLPFISQGQQLAMFFLCVVMQFVIACWLRPFRMGMLALAGGMAAAELLYFAPTVGPSIKAWTDTVLGSRIS